MALIETDHSQFSSAKVNNTWRYTSALSIRLYSKETGDFIKHFYDNTQAQL
jgi:hypothetical protein